MRKGLAVAEFLYCARPGQVCSVSTPHNNPTSKGIISSSVTEKETEAWKGKVT